jgi:flagellar FliL protein
MTRDESVVESIKKHMPVIRNNLTFLFSGRTYEDVKTIKGKERLRTAALEEVQNIMEEETGNSAVEALYFTSFVTQ